VNSSMRMKLHERASGMIEGVGRMQPITPTGSSALGETQTPAVTGRKAGADKRLVPETAADLSVSRMAADMAAAPPVDMDRVARLREAIASGAYRPDPMAIAEAIIAQGEAGA